MSLIETWSCHCCGEERPDDAISVRKIDVSHHYGLKPGSAQHNVRHCNDRQRCIDRAARASSLTELLNRNADAASVEDDGA